MAVTVLSSAEVARTVVETLEFDSQRRDLASEEVQAALLRRAASFRCPIDARRLARVVAETIANLASVSASVESDLSGMVDSLVAYGDLYEVDVLDGSHNGLRQLRLGPPRYVPMSPGTFLLLGVRPDGASLLTGELSKLVEHRSHVRTLRGSPQMGITAEVLESHGLIRVDRAQWLRHPAVTSPQALLDHFDFRLDSSAPCPDIPGVQILDPNKSVLYYNGRWRSIGRQETGRFIGRRPQAFGAGQWCYVETLLGEVVRVLDLPAREPWRRAVDEAWWLQAAIDQVHGHPQRIRIDHDADEQATLSLFSPLPAWVQRHLDIVGRPVPKVRGALLSYELPTSEAADALEFMSSMMWTEHVTGEAEANYK